MKKTLHFIHLIKKACIPFCMLLFLFSSSIGFAQTITPTKTVTVAPGVCGALDVELKIQGSNPVTRPLEVVLVIDVSGSMGDGNGKKPLAYAQDAAIDFINKMFLPANNPTGKNRVGIVTYSSTASIRRYLTNSSGQADLISVINGLSANGNTNIQDGLTKARSILLDPDPAKGATFDCATARSVVLLTDGVPNRTGTNGDGCGGSCSPAIITTANNIKTVTVSGTNYSNQIFSVGLFGAISGTEQSNAQTILNDVQSGGSFFTESGADLTGIYNQIFTQLSWVAKAITGTPFEKETIGANFTIGSVSVTKGTTTITGQEIAWNIDFLNVETITLKYRLTPKPNTCGSQQVSTSKLFFQNALCNNATQDIVSPMTDVPCPIITIASQTNVKCFGGNTGAITLNNPTGGQGPYTFKWTKNDVDFATTQNISGLTAGTYKVSAKDSNSCATGILTIIITQPAAALALAISSKTDALCYNTSTGSVTAGAVTNSVGTVNYSWKNSSNAVVGTTASVSNLPIGTYTVTVTDDCSSQSNSVTIGQPSAALALAASSKTDASCYGASTGSVTAGAVTNSVGTVTYTWKNASDVVVGTTASVSNLPTGTYTLTVTDSCSSKTDTVTIGQPAAALTLATSSKTDASCYGASTGSVTAGTVSNSVGTVTYTWKNASDVVVGTTASVSNLPTGTYTLTVTDSCSSKTDTVNIGQPAAALTLGASSKTDASCYQTSTGSVTAGTVSNSVGTVTYTWKNASDVVVGTTASVSNLPAGTYTLTVTDFCSSKTDTVTIGQPTAALVASINTKTDVDCKGNATGSATASATGGTETYYYSWNTNPVQATATATNLIAGTYTVKVTDQKGCTDTEEITINEPQSALTCSVVQDKPVTANGLSNGEATVTPIGGNGGYSYAWDNGETTQKALSLNAGTHTVTVTDSKGCKTTCTVLITQPAVLSCSVVENDPAKCYGDSNGKATVTPVGGNGDYTYAWDNGETTAQATGLNAGTHTVTVTDKLGYKTTCTVLIGQPQSALTCSVVQDKPVTANGLSNGEATVTPIGGNGGYSYAWDNGETTQKALSLNAGTHTVTVTDSKGCKTTCTVLITQPAVLSCSVVENDPAKCYGDSNGKATVTPVGGNGDYTYAWDNGETTAQATGLNAGTHTVTVTDKLGYKTTCTVLIGQPQSALTCSVVQDKPVTANGLSNGEATVTPLGGNGGYTYAWDNGEITAQATGLNAGTHTVTVTDSKGCKTTCTVLITQPAVLSCSVVENDPAKCYGDSNGKATVTPVGGNGDYTYLWDNGETTAQATGLNAGTHNVTVTDKLGYKTTCTVLIGQPQSALTCSVIQNKPVTANGLSNGEATVTPLGGNGGYTYAWDNGETTAQATGLNAGTHTVTVTDSKGCKTTCTVLITQPGVLSCSVVENDPAKCYGDSNGKATVTPVGGNGDYTYAWDNGETTAQATGLNAGTHTVTVTDKLGYKTTCTVLIGQPQSALTCSVIQNKPVTANGLSNGEATVTPLGGNGGYTYAWDNGETTAQATGLNAGTHTVTVTDSKGCKTTCTVLITQPDVLSCSVVQNDPAKCYGDSNGTATVTPVGGNGDYTYAWDNGETTAQATGLNAGTHTVTVTDKLGYKTTCTVLIGQPQSALTCSVVQNKAVTANGLSNGEATVTPIGGNGGYTYAWDNGETTQKAVGLNAGIHTVTVTDSKGCKTTCSVTISEPNVLSCSITQDDPAKCYGDSNGKATVLAIGGNGDYTYLWDNGETTAQATGLNAGTHTVTVTDKLGYKTTCTVLIGQPQSALTCSVVQNKAVTANGLSNGEATVTPIGGNGGYTYAWDNGEITAQATGLNAGTHTVTVTDSKGCKTTCTVLITQPDVLSCSVVQNDPAKCYGDSNGKATVLAIGGNGDYTYAWDNGETTAQATGLNAVTHTVTVTDKLGYKTTCTVIIGQPQSALTCSVIQNKPVTANGLSNGEATVTPLGGNGGYTYAWDNGEITAQATGLNAGTHTVTVTDSKGCKTTCTVLITQPDVLSCSVVQNDPAKCYGDSNGKATVTPVGGNGDYTYLWDNGETTAQATGLNAGTHTVTVTDKLGYKTTCTVTIGQPSAPLTATKSQINPGCGGAATGSATVVASGGTAPYTYSWNTNPVQTTATASNLAAGNYTVIITDSKGCKYSESFEIIDGDSVIPVINPLPVTSTINCPAEPVFAQATASDLNGTISSLTYEDTVTQGNCAGSYTKTRTWIAKDACGNVSLPVSQTIIVQDITAPTWTTQIASLNRTIECSNQQALTSAQALFPVASDLCDTDVSNIVKVSGQFVASEGCSNAGTYTNTWTVKDACGNTSETFNQVITIQDTTAPTWTTQTASLNKTIECSNQQDLTSAQALFPVATDACDTDVSNIEKVSGQFLASEGCSNAGTYTNTWTVKDACGNTSETFTQVITIQDTTAPTWTTQTASLNKTIECSNQQALTSAQALFPVATDACDNDVSNIEKVSGQFVASEGCSNAGTYTNTWTVKDDCGNISDTFTQVITIQDTTTPIFSGDLPTDITVLCDAVPEPANIEASDNCGGDLPIVLAETKTDIKNECGTEYTLTRKWTTSDCSGNTTSFTQIITVRDTTPPTGTAPADVAGLQNTAAIPAGSPSDITDAADNCGGNVNITVSDSNNGANGCDGNAYILTRTYTLTDCAGNKTELVQTFTVENKVSVSGVPTNVSCLDGTDGSIAVTSSPGATVIITNANNEVVGNTNLPAGTYTLTATAPVNGEGQICTATATVTITQPNYKVKISGQIINVDTNTPIANVPVTLIPQGTTPGPTLIRITNANGEYTFAGMVAGSYLVQVQDANLNSAYQLYPVDSSLFFTTLEECKFQVHNFLYGKSNLPVLGDYVWYDVNSNGMQDEWYDANNDGVVTKNIPDSNGAIDYSLWEWIDFNGDGSYVGPQNAGELNAAGFGNAQSSNILIDGPNGYHDEVIIGIQGFWRNRPESANPYGEYKVKLVRDANLDAVAAALGATGLVKVLPSSTSNTNKKATSKTGKSQMHTVCTTTSADGYIVNVTPEDLVHLDIDFGVNCKEYQDIVANDDNGGPFPGVNTTTPNVLNVLTNDTLEGVPVTASDVVITTVTPNEFLQLNPDGSVDILPNAPAGTLTMVYQICEADQTSNCDTAIVTITIEAPVMTVTATPICVNDVPYVDYVVTPGNFTPVNGVTISWADSNNNVVTTMNNLPLSGRVLWPGAVVDQAGNGVDWPGWLFQNNQWIEGADGFETLRPTATLTISVNPSQTIVVNYPPADPYCIARPTFAIVANDDTAGPIKGNTGGTNVVNVYTNDTLNGNALNPADITLTVVTPDPTGALTLNPDGSVNVAANTPTGTYVLTYQICENADFGNCDTAIVTVTVVNIPPVINALADTYSVNCNGYGNVGNVLSNDTIDLSPALISLLNFTLLPSTNGNAGISVDGSGNVNVATTTPPGTYNYDYQICLKNYPQVCTTRTITITVVPNVTNLASEACADDSTPIDLLSLLPANTPVNGTWVDTNGSNALQGSVLNPFGLALGNYVFEYKIADQSCPRTILLSMEVNDDCKVLPCENILVHNAFSPNGDGINDVFVIDGIGDLTCYPGNTVEIYNRWGILVFETTDYNNSTNAFDGTSRGRTTVNKSEGLPTGTYFYIVTYKSLDGNNVIQYNKKDGYLYLSK
ncbi:gliding motility-associated C-terminal domain-containing protein [Flavobacterium sp. 245]|uniref:HYR-like domain-containing protein n=1 Tax=Flavobacterium sp. 245 TaxID=2512115 RepID=UPI00106133A6|nr:gliding motility-associated C-terminal domain-containing protein [Flavobacterium sp. 245]TDO95638.1 gliding motility-associated-like protein [Flavobacterium sp. 245]